MKQEIVLPKFKVPGQTSWLIKGLWIAGGLVVLQGVVLGAVYWSRQNTEKADQVRAAAAAAAAERATVEAQRRATPPPVQPPARMTDKAAIATSTTMAAAPSIPKAAPSRTGAAARGKMAYGKARGRKAIKPARYMSRAEHHAALRRKAAAGRGKVYARSAPRRAVKPKPAKRDPIDDLLRKFK